MKKRARSVGDILLCTASLLILFIFMLALLLSSDASFSEKENRSLKTRPLLTFKKLIDGRYFNELTDFCGDQFPARTLFTTTSAFIDLGLLRSETNGIIIAKDGYLISRHDRKELNTLKTNCNSISLFIEKQKNNNIPAFVFVAPRSIDVNEEMLPTFYNSSITKESYKILNQSISSEYLIDIKDELKERSGDEYIWYRTDHHWTATGAYYAYLSIGEKLLYEPQPKEAFTIDTATDSFLGTSFSRLGIDNFRTKDSIELYRYNNDDSFLITEPTTNKTTTGLYNFNALTEFDKYKVFLCGNTDILQVRDTTKNKPRLLIIKDSFANSIVPFLAIHYDIDMIDLRYYKGSVQNYIEENGFECVLILYGIDTLASDISCSNILK